MPTSPNGPRPQPPAEDPQESRTWSWYRLFAVVALLGMGLFWIWAFSPLADRDNPDRLDDTEFTVAAEGTCATARDRLEQVSPARDAQTPEERAVQLDEANAILAAMVLELRALPVADADEARVVGLWLDDWVIYLGDRERHADTLRAGEDTAFVVTEKSGNQITEPIDVFADLNLMLSCATPLDV